MSGALPQEQRGSKGEQRETDAESGDEWETTPKTPKIGAHAIQPSPGPEPAEEDRSPGHEEGLLGQRVLQLRVLSIS